jgi:predicted CoA-substrate-specific enzyme activase
METTSAQAIPGIGEYFEGYNIGSVSVKRVQLFGDGTIQSQVWKHAGNPTQIIQEIHHRNWNHTACGVIVTGPQASSFINLPHRPESVCIEAALRHLQIKPDLVLSLGGENFVVYCLLDGAIRSMLSSNRCAAGSGEFLVQQFGRMNLDLEAGIRAAKQGHRIKMASRCSVHCKSDATHKLNKGECAPADIALSLIADLGNKIATLVGSANWPCKQIMLAGGLSQNEVLVAELRSLLPMSCIHLRLESLCLEALGAAVIAKEEGRRDVPTTDTWIKGTQDITFEILPPLKDFIGRVRRISENHHAAFEPGMKFVLGVDAGSTTTKAILLDYKSRQPIAASYLKTHGNPVRATSLCLEELKKQCPSEFPINIVQAAVTGSGRDLVSIYLDNSLSFNEILAHARAAREAEAGVDTLFELGGQDAKFVALENGIPIDYAMNDGCSAGTGSFLEEAAASDMQIPVENIGLLALGAANPVAFNERCAAFINSEVRSALQQGVPCNDVLAGLVYAVADNYLSRVVGARHIGQKILLQGGVALNPALAPAIAARTGMHVTMPSHPELMGCVGAALMATDLMSSGRAEELNRELGLLGSSPMKAKGTFICQACENHCEIQQIALSDRTYPFGGLCAKWEVQRRPATLRLKEGKDLVGLRQEIMFKDFAPQIPANPHGRVGLPLALTTYELYPFYTKLLTELGYEVVLSRFGSGDRRTFAPVCYPGEIMHAAIDDLLSQGVDYIFLPYLRSFEIPQGHTRAHTCSVVQDMPGIIIAAFEVNKHKMLSPEIGLSRHLIKTSEQEIVRMAKRLGIAKKQAKVAFHLAIQHQKSFEEEYSKRVQQELGEIKGPAVILVGRPYAAFAPDVNLSIPRKIASRGFTVIPGDALPFDPPANERDVWHFTQRTFTAIEFARKHRDYYICALSCYSCGPDAIMHHRLRCELEGKPFCFLEIDAHTAHAGIETRIGAFLDIIEERRRSNGPQHITGTPLLASSKLEKRNGNMGVVNSAGEFVRLDDERVHHILLADLPEITSRIMASLYGTLGWRTSTTPDMNFETLQKARQVCSGRECLPFLAMMGKVVSHLETRPADEFTLFHLLESEGSCQISNWYDAVNVVMRRLGQGNTATLWPSMKNNYLGGGDKTALMLVAATLAGDLMEEARSSLRCLAKNPESALRILSESEDALVKAASQGLLAADRELPHIAKRLGQIPLRGKPKDAPRILLFSGINRVFVDNPVREFLESRGILAKTSDVSEFNSFVEFRHIWTSGFEYGSIHPEEHSPINLLYNRACHFSDIKTGLALRAYIHCRVIEWLEKRWWCLMEPSGLLFSDYIPFREIAREGHNKVSWNGYTEAPCTLGRYYASLHKNGYDGYINIGAFNCTPANTATAVINALSRQNNAPYATLEADGTVITPGQLRQLETVAAQCLQALGKRM